MGRKVFLSVLGSTNYGSCHYVDTSTGFKSCETRFVQEATLGLIEAQKWPDTSVGFVFVTRGEKGSYQLNWKNNGHRSRESQEIILLEGLNTRLEKMKLPFEITPIEIDNGDNEKEIWQIFDTIFSVLKPEDVVYFDITHGFRYLPMLVLVLNNYSKFLKSTTIQKITYGNYESRNDNNEAPLIDLTSFSVLQDWTSAVNQFVSFGSVKSLIKLINNDELTISLINFSDSFAGSRGVDIWEGHSVTQLSQKISEIQIQNYPIPFEPIFNQIKNELKKLSEGNLVERGIEAITYCNQHNLFQQGITLLSELIITYVLIYLRYEWKDELLRNAVSGCLNITKKEKYDYSMVKEKLTKMKITGEIDEENMKQISIKHDELVGKIFDLPMKKKIGKELYSPLSQGTRNDINHAGVRKNPKTTQELNNSFLKYFGLFVEIYKKYPCS